MSRLPGVLLRVLLLLGAVLLPSAWPGGLPRPDLVILVVAAVGLLHRPSTGMLVGLLGGWLLDLVPPGAEPLGATALTYALVGLLLGLGRRLTVASPLLPWVATGLAAAAVLAVRWVASAAGLGVALPSELTWSWLMTMLVAVPLLPLLMGLERRLLDRGWV
ncbi:rod shape-determining protein MreD [Ornithinimicrobium pratense]|uniref:Rod shape-determining protein MreD n=1 Tax=Ornithinimicrobium pratense TaxID=2593973 RepID=A0A5J6V2P7_9MICO|nr:rod shape-determining protein MreD [Ornithinimicrobium pratense]QFG67968.1 rod shape-determining protein MreD [Ornithinimicrobium pratense]